MIQELQYDQDFTIEFYILPISSMSTQKQCSYENLNGLLSIKYGTSLNDIANFGQMFRAEILPMLGVDETIKTSKLSSLMNNCIDYNKNKQTYHQIPHLTDLMLQEISDINF